MSRVLPRKDFRKRTREIEAANGDDIDRTTKDSFYSSITALEIFPGACPVTNRGFNVCFIGLNLHFGFGNKKKTVYIKEQCGF